MNFEPYLRTWLVPRIPQLVTVEVHDVSAPGRALLGAQMTSPSGSPLENLSADFTRRVAGTTDKEKEASLLSILASCEGPITAFALSFGK